MDSLLPEALTIRSVRLDTTRLQTILDTLDRSGCEVTADKRRHLRHTLRSRQIILYTMQSGRQVAFVVPTPNVSRSGLSFLHSQMMYEGTECRLDLPTTDGNWMCVTGRVVRCRHVHGMVHEVGMKFNSLICLEDVRGLNATDEEMDSAPVDLPASAQG